MIYPVFYRNSLTDYRDINSVSLNKIGVPTVENRSSFVQIRQCYFQELVVNKVKRGKIREHSKASERYVDATFFYNDVTLELSVPIEYRRTGTDIPDSGIDGYLEEIYDEMDPNNWAGWHAEQVRFWQTKPRAAKTKQFFDVLSQEPKWQCVNCNLPPNPNPARRIQDLKEFGYTLATNTKRQCASCRANTTQLLLLPLSRGGITGYETWTPETRSRIVKVLACYDAFEGKVGRKEGLLPDHKFPEIRWDLKTRRESLSDLSENEIKHDFQLLSNQRNQQKREVCRACYQTGKRGNIFGISFFYQGSETWDPNIPKTGKDAEEGCRGCGWYDIQKWRVALEGKVKPRHDLTEVS